MLLAALASVACLATPVHGDVVRAGPFVGGIAPQYDVVNGRFRLHVGGYRDRAIGLSQKIPWFIARSYAVGPTLVVRGRRLGSRRARFKSILQQASSENNPRQWIYPSSFSPPSAGCWRLTFQSGRVTGRLTVLVSNRRASRDPWGTLHRPLRLPHLAPGADCPRSPTQPAAAQNPAFWRLRPRSRSGLCGGVRARRNGSLRKLAGRGRRLAWLQGALDHAPGIP
jgi:hypothetical protein